MHPFVERGQAHSTAGQVSPISEHSFGARRCLRLARYAATLYRGVLARPQLFDQLLLVGRARLPGRDRSHERKDLYEEATHKSADVLQTEDFGEGEGEQATGCRCVDDGQRGDDGAD